MSSKTKTAAAKEGGKSALVPKLRFPKFRNDAGWEPTTIGALGRFYYGKSAPKWSLSEDAPTPCVRYGELYTKFGPVISETYSRTNTDPETLRFSKGGEILIPRVGEKPEDFGKCCAYLPLKDIAIGEMISVLETEQNPLFYTYYFRHLHREFAKVVEGQNVKNLYFAELQPLSIHRPSKPEQEKIAECLSSVDELIAAQAWKLDALKTHKKALMEQLFPREGETQPRLRFPEFQNAGEWEETELGQLISIKGRIGYRGYTVADIVNAGEGAISLSPSNITGSGVLGFDKATYITWAKYHESPEIKVERGQTLLVKTGSTFGKVAYVWDLPQECTVNPQVVVLKPHSIHPYFLFLLVFGEVIQTMIRAIVVGGAIPTLSQEAVSKFKIRVPTSAEQQCIAACLASLDDLIVAQTKRLETLRTHKKGLMQQLFPSPEEVEA